MADYFDVSDPQDRFLLPDDVLGDDDVERVVDQVEGEIIATYRKRRGDEFYVMLYGYEDSDPSGVRLEFAAAMKRAIAEIVKHRIRHADVTGAIKSESQGRRSWSYQDNFDSEWPKGWQSWLQQFDLRTPAHAI